MKRDSDYVDGEEFERWVIACQRGNHKYDDDIAKALQLMARRIMKKWKFNVDWEECVQDVVIVAWTKIDKFHEGYGAAFNFFTTILINAMKQHYRVDKSYEEMKLKYLDHMIKKLKLNREDVLRQNGKRE